MSCSNPMIAVKTGNVNPETGKDQYKFLKSLKSWCAAHPQAEDEVRDFGKPWVTSYSGALDARQFEPLANIDGEFIGFKYKSPLKVLPCGQCLECRIARSRQWANRIMMEAISSGDKVYFITLTYDSQHVPHSTTVDGVDVLTLRPEDLQKFIKLLRRMQKYYHDNKIRFYAVGEYGSQFHRPHYHLIVFGLILDDIEEYGRNKAGRMLHTSKTIEDLWSRGRVEIEPMTWELAAYCARYTVKKYGKKEEGFYETMNIVPEFSRMSQGFGKAYFDEHKDQIYKYDRVFIPTATGSIESKPPIYFDRKYDDIYPSEMERIKIERESAANKSLIAELQNYSGSYVQLLEEKHQKFTARTRSLRRTLE